jgi:1-hydroxycarotenoid 3,4-desaturase
MSSRMSLPFVVSKKRPIVVIGAGVGGLAAGFRLAAAGQRVVIIERHDWFGGKARSIPSPAGPIAAGPTVLTLRSVFDDLFSDAGLSLEDFITLSKQDILARHFWSDGAQLDLMADAHASASNIETFAGAKAADEYWKFESATRALFDAFDAPMMRTARPSVRNLIRVVAKKPSLLADMAPGRVMARDLARRFSDPRLAQLFGRYATYVGGSPLKAPALLSLIWQAEARGVWLVDGGIAALAGALADQFLALGGEIRTNTDIERIDVQNGRVTGVGSASGETIAASAVVFNGDPLALATGALGQDVSQAVSGVVRAGRSLSARVWSFAAHAKGVPLSHHNVFFADDPYSEFRDLEKGLMPRDPSLYVCAQDRGAGPTKALERFEIILNAPALNTGQIVSNERLTCHQRTFPTLGRMGLHLTPQPAMLENDACLTVPHQFNALFPASLGSLYGQSPNTMTASLSRPTARSKIAGLYLCGGGAHPGAGVPMAALSGRHAAEAILQDQTLTSPSRPMGTRGGTSTVSAMMANARSR